MVENTFIVTFHLKCAPEKKKSTFEGPVTLYIRPTTQCEQEWGWCKCKEQGPRCDWAFIMLPTKNRKMF